MDKGEALVLIHQAMNKDAKDMDILKKLEGYILSSDEEFLYTVSEVSQKLKSNKNFVNKLIKCGFLPALKLGRTKITRKSLLDFLEWSVGKDITDPTNVVEMDIKKQPSRCNGIVAESNNLNSCYHIEKKYSTR